VNWRLDEAVAAGRAKSLATHKVGNIGEQAKVQRCTATEDLAYQNSSLGADAFENMQPLKADEHVGDEVRETQVESWPCV